MCLDINIKIISHRGYWINSNEKNSADAFERSFKLGFGTETDIRDYNGKLVISHDIATPESMPVSTFFEIYKSYDLELPLALNIKADGLQRLLLEAIERYEITRYFCFDASIPDLLQYQSRNVKNYIRYSEYETDSILLENANGIWLDDFGGNFITSTLLDSLFKNKKENHDICIVSPELHSRNEKELWATLKQKFNAIQPEGILLCTDKPEEAREYFNDK
tara:strand:- start:1078 stop:1740 length:663 start_codon:yes stop_codon:yes gene_type:complete